MVIKAVLFDWFNTLVHYDPPREELYREVFHEHGITVTLQEIYKGLLVGDRYFFSGLARARVRGAGFEEQARQFMLYPRAIAAEAGLDLPPALQLEIIRKVLKEFKGAYALYEDVLPIFSRLKEKGFILGIITNADKNVAALIESLGAKPFLDVLVTSEEVGAEKPAPAIFLAALEKARVLNQEALYVGDQYQSDVLGAGGAGMKALLIDRYDISPGPLEYPRIKSLAEIEGFV
jgi:putative hydrolase of the HAD superfamily